MTSNRVDHINTMCRICGGSKTHVYRKRSEWYRDLISYIGDRKFFGIEYIKKWLCT